MQSEQYTDNGVTYVRIRLTEARKYYGQGKTILLVPEGMRLANAWVRFAPMNIRDCENDKRTFDKRISDYKFYHNLNGRNDKNYKYFIKQTDL